MMKAYKGFVLKGLTGGVLIGLAALVYSKAMELGVGPFCAALLFSFGLMAVIGLSANLYTGKAGYLWQDGLDSRDLAFRLYLNALGASLVGSIGIGDASIWAGKIAKPWYSVFGGAIGCGFLIFLAVEMSRRYGIRQTWAFVALCVISFILAGFEHSIADIAYFGGYIVNSNSSLVGKSVGYLLLIVIGNLIGSLVAHWLAAITPKEY